MINLKKYKNIKILVLLSALILEGCAHTSENFDCKYNQGVGCKSISKVNRMVKNGELIIAEDEKLNPSNHKKSAVAIREDVITADDLRVERVTEQHLRVWLAPFQDEHGHFHEASIIHTVLKPGYWQAREAK